MFFCVPLPPLRRANFWFESNPHGTTHGGRGCRCRCRQVSVQQADCEKDLAAAIPLVKQAEARQLVQKAPEVTEISGFPAGVPEDQTRVSAKTLENLQNGWLFLRFPFETPQTNILTQTEWVCPLSPSPIWAKPGPGVATSGRIAVCPRINTKRRNTKLTFRVPAL